MAGNACGLGFSFREKLRVAKEAAVHEAWHRIGSELAAAEPVTQAQDWQKVATFKASENDGGNRYPLKSDSPEASKSFDIWPVTPSTSIYPGLVSARKRTSVQGSLPSSREGAEACIFKTETASTKDDRTTKRSRLAPPKKPIRGPRPVYQAIANIETRTTQHSSKWYEEIDTRKKFARKDLESLKNLHRLIRECLNTHENGVQLDVALAKFRKRLHQAEFWDFLSGVLIKKSRLLEDGGLSVVFLEERSTFPWDIISDSWSLHQRWFSGQLDPHLLVGIESKNKTTSSGKSVKSRNLEGGYPGGRSVNCAGENELVNGQWWLVLRSFVLTTDRLIFADDRPLQICALRDGAHGEMEAGIHGQAGKGAYSIVMSSGGYSDVDNGEHITYCGTASANTTPTAGTILLKESKSLHSPVRVLRSYALPASNQYRPAKGLRYDGLYDVVGYNILDEETAMHAFRMTRREGQDPIRYQGAVRRPTDEQLVEYAKIRQLSGLGM
ncbi:hypothetical protein MMC17_007858 [Xylographa soralifera]|nr:hypothetical protein [Xylographa soralifera]